MGCAQAELSVWSEEDDEALKQLVARLGTAWAAIAAAGPFKGRYDRHQVRVARGGEGGGARWGGGG